MGPFHGQLAAPRPAGHTGRIFPWGSDDSRMFSLKSVATVGGLTLASRALGFLREVLMAQFFGTGPIAEAFVVAMRLPNLFRQLFAEGAFNSAFVPMFAGELETPGPRGGKIGAQRFAESVLATLLLVLAVMTILAELAMPWLIRVFAPGFHEFPEKFAAAVLFTQITFPYLLFMSLGALQGGVLNALGRFADAAAAPILLNVVMIIALYTLVPGTFDAAGGVTAKSGEVLSIAVAVAGMLQFLWLAVTCQRTGMHLRLPWPNLSPAVKRVMLRMVPGLVGGGVNQINLTVATILATLQPQAVTYLYYSDRLYQLPLALIGSAIGVVLLPSLTRALRGDRPEEAMRIFNRAIEMGFFLSLPAAVALTVAAAPIISVLYERGAFTHADSIAVSYALTAIALGLPAYVLNKSLSAGFLSREDTMTPVPIRGHRGLRRHRRQPLAFPLHPLHRDRARHGGRRLGELRAALLHAAQARLSGARPAPVPHAASAGSVRRRAGHRALVRDQAVAGLSCGWRSHAHDGTGGAGRRWHGGLPGHGDRDRRHPASGADALRQTLKQARGRRRISPSHLVKPPPVVRG